MDLLNLIKLSLGCCALVLGATCSFSIQSDQLTLWCDWVGFIDFACWPVGCDVYSLCFRRFYGLQCCCIPPYPAENTSEYVENNDECGSNVDTWDAALRKSIQEFQHLSYSIFTCNCHSFVANGLNRLGFQAGGWNVVNLAIFIFLKGRWVNKTSIVKTYLPPLVVLGLGLIFGGGTFLAYLVIFMFVLIGWFLLGTYCFKMLIHV